jgi:hypothetical protein
MPYTSNDSLNVFLSYASEDTDIAEALTNTLREAFVNNVDISTMSEFKSGLNWKELIADRIAETDIFIAIATGEIKPAFSFTGYEVGAFSFSLREARHMARFDKLQRRLIPFAVLARLPDTASDYQGIDIDLQDLRAVRFDSANLAATLQGLANEDGGDPNGAVDMVHRLLDDVESIIRQALYRDRQFSMDEITKRNAVLRKLALEFCGKILRIMLKRKKDVYTPKSRLIIRIEPDSANEEGVKSVENAKLRIEGPCYEAFGFAGGGSAKSYNWKEFTAHASDDLAFGWRESLNALLSSAQGNDFIDNNSIISFDGKRIFRVFLSRRTIYYSNATEHDIYVVEMLRNRDHGDHDTTILLKAMEVALGYRFMFLEGKSEYSPAMFRTENVGEIKKRVLRMMTSLNLLLQISEEYGLNKPKTILNILGMEVTEHIDDMYARWDKEKKALYGAATTLLKTETVTTADKAAFVGAMEHFADYTRDINRDYLTSVLGLLRSKIEGDAAPRPAQPIAQLVVGGRSDAA